MPRSRSEEATLQFYNWEYHYRGYSHFDTPVDIEVPYTPFYNTKPPSPVLDDGRVPTLFQSIGKRLSPRKHTEDLSDNVAPFEPRLLDPSEQASLSCFSLSFTQGTEIIPSRNIEFLNMLSYSEHLISFEIVGSPKDIRIQISCSTEDKERVHSLLQGYFPLVLIQEVEADSFGFDTEKEIAVCDFGLSEEFMRPISQSESFAIDPLTAVIASMDCLQGDDVCVFQVLFKGITSPLARDIRFAVSDGVGGSFFDNAPEMPHCAENKTANPLFSVVMRIGVQGNSNERSQYLAQEFSQSITLASSSEYNRLVPLSNKGYDYDFHVYNLNHRLSNRLGFILSSSELGTFVHYPNRSIVSKKFGLGQAKTKALNKEALGHDCVLGRNFHQGSGQEVSLGKEARLRHTHIIGATGVGKSTLIANMILEDIRHNRGCVLFDPHGDIAEDILLRIPKRRKEDVIVVDPSDTDFPIGFNLFDAHSEAEKIVLSSDLVSAFRRHATAWGDNMTAVLSNAINTFLESSKGGTLIELKRFLLEEKYRKTYLESVDDPSLHYYWEHEYAMVKKGIAPLLTRIDTFLRPKIVRYMLAQQGGLDFRACMEEKKIILLKLSQGLIGAENSYLLGSLFLSKLNQVAQGRQNLPKEKHHPYYVYLDEFQNFITPSISQILSGARKYGLGLVLAHQELAQIEEAKVLNSVISNPHIRICFRLGDNDAKRLSDGFSYFEADDLQNLGVGEAIVRIGSKKNDCNLKTFPMPVLTEEAQSIKEFVIENTRMKYATPREAIEELLVQLLPNRNKKNKEKVKSEAIPETSATTETLETVSPPKSKEPDSVVASPSDFEVQKQEYIKQAEEKEVLRKHRSLQNYVKTMATARGFKTTLEAETKSGGRVDVALVQNDIAIAVEISVSNTPDYEVKNLQKCLAEDYAMVFMLSEDKAHLEAIQSLALEKIDKKHHSKLQFLSPEKLSEHLDAFMPKVVIPEKRIRGYRVKLNYTPDTKGEKKKQSLTDLLMQSLRRKK